MVGFEVGATMLLPNTARASVASSRRRPPRYQPPQYRCYLLRSIRFIPRHHQAKVNPKDPELCAGQFLPHGLTDLLLRDPTGQKGLEIGVVGAEVLDLRPLEEKL
jgi:hypothetical protein